VTVPTGPNQSDCEYEIGEFTIAICANRGSPTFFNRTRLVDGMHSAMHAPHVYAEGRACLGTAVDTIPRLVAGYQWATAVALSIQFLESANIVDQAGQHVIRWPFSPRQIEINKQLLEAQQAAQPLQVVSVDTGRVETVGAVTR
jgi:hypothetical protein